MTFLRAVCLALLFACENPKPSGEEPSSTPQPAAPVALETGAPLSALKTSGSCTGQPGTGVIACNTGDAVSCDVLGASWSASSTATCRGDCSGYDTSTCDLADAAHPWEVVIPKDRATDPKVPAPSPSSEALCNDGSGFGFYVQIMDPQSKSWMIALEGGGVCDENVPGSECSKRKTSLVTGISTWKKQVWVDWVDDRALDQDPGKGGLASDDPSVNPDFWNFNRAVAYYCTSDAWSGETGQQSLGSSNSPKSVSSFVFRGRKNFEAMMAVLMQRYGLHDAKSTAVLFVGGSAGALGVHANGWRMAQLLPQTSKAWKKDPPPPHGLKVLSDGGSSPVDWDMDGAGPGTDTVSDAFTLAMGTWGAGKLVPKCTKEEAAEPGRCYLGPSALPDIATKGSATAAAPRLQTLAVAWQLDTTLFGLQTKKKAIDLTLASTWAKGIGAVLSGTSASWPLTDLLWTYAPCGPKPKTSAELEAIMTNETWHVQIWKSDPKAPTESWDVDRVGSQSARDVLKLFWDAKFTDPPQRVVETGPCLN